MLPDSRSMNVGELPERARDWDGAGDKAGYHPITREFSLTEGAARGTRGRLGPGGRDQRGFVAVIMVLELGQAWDLAHDALDHRGYPGRRALGHHHRQRQ
jgi:hypothetical protein